MKHDESKLPAWARDSLRNLRAEVERLHADANPTLYRIEDAPREAVYLDLFSPDYRARPHLRPLPEFAGVTYVDDRGIPIRLLAERIIRKDGVPTSGGLVLHGRDMILAAPVAANVIRAISLSMHDLAIRQHDRTPKEA